MRTSHYTAGCTMTSLKSTRSWISEPAAGLTAVLARDRAPVEIVRPVPVISVIALSEPTDKESVFKVRIVDEPVTKIPAVVEVGVRVLVQMFSQEPF